MSVNLQKGQKISLDKEAGGTLTKITMGLGWDAVKTKGFLGFGGGGEGNHLDRAVRWQGERRGGALSGRSGRRGPTSRRGRW